MAVKKRGERQQGPGAPPRQQLVGLLNRERPGDRGGGWRCATGLRQLLPPAQEIIPVVLAGQRRRRDHLAGLGERQRLAAKGFDEVDRAEALVRVGCQTAPQVTQGFAGI